MATEARPTRHCLQRLRQYFPKLSPAQQGVAEYILQSPHEVLGSSVHEIAAICATSPSTVVRLAQDIGFDGIKSMKIALAQEIGTILPRMLDAGPGASDGVLGELLDNTIRGVQQTAASIDEAAVARAVEMIRAAPRVDVFGSGSSYLVGSDLVEKLKRLGIHANIDANDYIQAISAAGLMERDLAIGISYSGETRSTLEHLHMAREQGAGTIVVTNFVDATIVQLADVVLSTSVTHHLFPDGSLGGRIAQLLVIDLLFVRLFASDIVRFRRSYHKYNQILLNKASRTRDRVSELQRSHARDEREAEETEGIEELLGGRT